MGQKKTEEYAFPVNLRRFRKERGLSQGELAKKAHISQASISYYENCVEYPTVDKIYDIATALDVSVSELISNKIIPKESKK